MKTLVYKVYIAAILLLIVGGMAWGWMAATGKNVVSKIFGSWAGVVYGLVGLSALFLLMWGRDAFLPFLGTTVFPCSVLQDKVPESADTTVSVSVRPGAKVLYWAAEPATDGLKELQSWREAYGSMENAGIATANQDGVVILKFRHPQHYTVGIMNRTLPVHVHYRECGDNGMLSPVQTHFMEGFQNPEEEVTEVMPAEEVLPTPVEEPMPVEEPQTPETVPETVPETAQVPEIPDLEGFSSEPLLAAAQSVGSTFEPVSMDPRLEELRQSVLQQSTELLDSNTMGFTEHYAFGGTELDAAFAAPEVQPIPPAV